MSCKEHYIYNADGSISIKENFTVPCKDEYKCICQNMMKNMMKDSSMNMCTDVPVSTVATSKYMYINNNCQKTCGKCTPTSEDNAADTILCDGDNINNIITPTPTPTPSSSFFCTIL